MTERTHGGTNLPCNDNDTNCNPVSQAQTTAGKEDQPSGITPPSDQTQSDQTLSGQTLSDQTLSDQTLSDQTTPTTPEPKIKSNDKMNVGASRKMMAITVPKTITVVTTNQTDQSLHGALT